MQSNWWGLLYGTLVLDSNFCEDQISRFKHDIDDLYGDKRQT